VSGKEVTSKEEESIFGKTVISMRASGLTHLNMVKELIFLRTETSFKEYTAKGNLMGRALTSGRTARPIPEISRMGSSTARESGERIKGPTAITTQGSSMVI
jgi:hypothetical protein